MAEKIVQLHDKDGNKIYPVVKGIDLSYAYVKKSGDTMAGNLTVPTVIGNLQGNAATATKATQDGNGNIISSTYLPLTGGAMTGELKVDYMRPNNNTKISVYSNLYATNLPTTILSAILTTADGVAHYIVNDTNDTQPLTAGKIIIIQPDSTPSSYATVYINYNNSGYKEAYDSRNNYLSYYKCRAGGIYVLDMMEVCGELYTRQTPIGHQH